MSIDPVTTDANTGNSFNRYNYAANNPYKFVDPDGREIRVADRSDRARIARYINSETGGKYSFNKNGVLVQKSSSGPGGSSYLGAKYTAAIASSAVITMEIRSHVYVNGELQNVDSKYGGGVTITEPGKDVRVVISGNPNNNLTDTTGQPLSDKPAQILTHEFVGHAASAIGITDTGNAVDNENKARAQIGDGAQRAPEPTHVEK